jgi:polysaccharide deacetylase family protein (PEP-CTERM system associated)
MTISVKTTVPICRDGRLVNAMSVDVEDYFHAQALSSQLPRAQWDGLERRVQRNTLRILSLFAEAGIKATFFVLGWVAERHPALVRRIVAGGHELASHGWDHTRVDCQTPEAFAADIGHTKRVLEDIGGVRVRGYRAATFSIGDKTPWAFSVLEDQGYAYSSSIYPVRHDLYGMPSAPRFAFYPLGPGRIEEYPLTSVRMGKHNLPCGGGGYFRLLPYGLSLRAMKRVNDSDGQPCIFYFHPWEIDTEQPRITGLPWKSQLRHYTNIGTMEARLRRLVTDLSWDRIDRVHAP